MPRRIGKGGNSLKINLPPEFLRELGLIRGSWVLLTLDSEQKKIEMRPLDAGPTYRLDKRISPD